MSAEKARNKDQPSRNTHPKYRDCGVEIPLPINRNQTSWRNGWFQAWSIFMYQIIRKIRNFLRSCQRDPGANWRSSNWQWIEAHQICVNPWVHNTSLKELIGYILKMTGSQFIILKTGYINALNIYSAFPVRTVPLGDQVVEKWNLPLKKLSHLIWKQNYRVRTTPFAALSEVVVRDIEHHWVLTWKSENHMLWASWWKTSSPCQRDWSRVWSSLWKQLPGCRKYKRQREMLNCTTSIEACGTLQIKNSWVLPQKKCKEKKGMEGMLQLLKETSNMYLFF